MKPEVSKLRNILGVSFLIFITLSGAALLFTLYSFDIIDEIILITDISFWEKNKTVITHLQEVINGLFLALTAATSIFSLFYLVKAYDENTTSTIFNNHLSHYKHFESILDREIKKFPRISPSSINTSMLYYFIYPDAEIGDFKNNRSYRGWLKSFNDAILQCEQSRTGTPNNQHQKKVIRLLNLAGVKMDIKPEKTYPAIESDIANLINSVNESIRIRGRIKSASYHSS